MSLTPALLRWLHSDEAAAALAALTAAPPEDAALLAALAHLRRRHSPEQAAALVETARLRQHAAAKFPQAAVMFFARAALEQATPAPVAAHTARRFAPFPWVADLGCGLGGDSLALAAAGPQVLAVDREPLSTALVAANARALGLAARITPLQADVCAPAWRVPAAWADPARRRGDRRIFDPAQLLPPLSALLSPGQPANLGVKLMPGLSHAAIPPETEAEWISLRGELKQAVLWRGDLARDHCRRAVILPAGVEIGARGATAALAPPGLFLYEPDPAILRAGAVADLAVALGLWQIDPTIAYLSGDDLIPTPCARVWRVLEHHPFDLKNLNRRLRLLQGRVIAVKKRGSPVDPEAFRRRLSAHPGGRPLVVALTQAQGRPWMLICEEMPNP